MAETGVDWFGVLDQGRLLGWASASDLDGSSIADVELRPFVSTVSSDASLREALDVVVTGHTRLAVVVDEGVFRGVLDIEAIAEEITE
jgi:CBS domain-containing protein